MTENPLKYSTGFRRLGASLFDTLVFVPINILDSYVSEVIESKLLIILWLIFVTSLYYMYIILMHYKFGQTLGKIVASVKVTDISEKKRISFRQALKRDGLFIIVEIGLLIYLVYNLYIINTQLSFEEIFESYQGYYFAFSMIWFLLEIITMLTNKKRRAFHDYIGGTVVVRTDDEEGLNKSSKSSV